MKSIKQFFLFALLTTPLVFFGCNEGNMSNSSGPSIIIDSEDISFDGLNEGDTIQIPIVVKSDHGIKRTAYFLMNETPNGIVSDEPVYLDNVTYPKEIREELKIPVIYNAKELVIISFDSRNKSSELHFKFNDIRRIPQIIFKDSVKYRESVFENKNFTVSGRITSEYDLKKVTVSTVVNNVVSEERLLALQGQNFTSSVLVVKGLSGIVIKAQNIYDGMTVDTFKIGSVVDDAVNIVMKGGISSLQNFFVDETNIYQGTIVSGSNVRKLTYRVKKSGVYGAEIPITSGATLDEFDFNLAIRGEYGMESVRITGENENNKISSLELSIPKVEAHVLYFKDVKLTTKIGQGLKNWFSCYLEPHVFDQQAAMQNQEMMDFVCAVYDNSQVCLLSPHVFNSSTLYNAAITPYMQGFTQANYCLITANRNSITFDSFDGISTEEGLKDFIDKKIVGTENYNVYTAARGTNRELVPGKGMVYAWGPSSGNHKAFGLIIVKAASFENGVGNVTLDIKVPRADNRTLYNASARVYP